MLDFLIVYEHKARDLENACLVKAELELRGYSVDILQLQSFYRLKYMFFKKPKVLVVTALYDDKVFYGHVNAIVGNIYKVVNLQCEQVVSKEFLKTDYQIPKQKAAYAVTLCWGQKIYDRLESYKIKNLILTGAIQIDFLQKEFNNYYYSNKYIRDIYKLKNKKIFLYISSFTLSDIEDSTIESIKLFDSYYDIKNISKESKKITLEWFEKLLIYDKEIIIIYRPHPNEKYAEDIKIMESKYENFRIIGDFSVKQWISISDKIFTWCSTSIAEIYFSKKNCYILRPFKISENLDNEIYEYVDSIDTYEKFINAVNSQYNAKFPIPQYTIKEYYNNPEDILSYIRICDLLEKVRNTDIYDLPKEVKYKIKILDILKPIIKRLIFIFKINENTPIFNLNYKVKNWLKIFWEYMPLYKRDATSKREINEITSKIKKIIENRK